MRIDRPAENRQVRMDIADHDQRRGDHQAEENHKSPRPSENLRKIKVKVDHIASLSGDGLTSPPVEFPLRRWALSLKSYVTRGSTRSCFEISKGAV